MHFGGCCAAIVFVHALADLEGGGTFREVAALKSENGRFPPPKKKIYLVKYMSCIVSIESERF